MGTAAQPTLRLLRCARNDRARRHCEEPQATKQSLPLKFIATDGFVARRFEQTTCFLF
jgi:hypothetical protein